MAISYVSSTGANGSNTATPALPAGWAAGDLAILMAASAEEDATLPVVVPSGGDWTYRGSEVSATGTWGSGTGPRRLTFWTRVLAAGDGNPTINLPSSGGVGLAVGIVGLRKAATEAWSVMTPVFGEETTSGTSLSQALNSTPSRLTTGAWAIGAYAIPNNVGGTNTVSAEGMTATGATFGTVTERVDQSSTGGYTVRLAAAVGAVTSGTATAPPVLTATLVAASTAEIGMIVVLATTSSISAQQAPRGDVRRRNVLTNPGAEVGATTGWTSVASVGSTTFDTVDVLEEGLGRAPGGSSGRRAFRITGAATNTTNLGLYQTLLKPYPIGAVVTFSFDVYVPAGSTVDTVRVAWATTSAWTESAQAGVAVPGWARYSASYTVGTNRLERVFAYTVDSGNARGVDTVYFDNLMVEEAGAAYTYFDGDSMLEGWATAWDGTPQLSESVLYLAASPPRVGITLSNWGTDTPTTVYRVHEGGERVPVRGGGLTPSGGAAFVWDYEFPTNADVYYVADDSGTERTTALVDEVILRRNGNRNPCCTVNTTDWATVANGVGTLTGARVDGSISDGPMVAGVRRDYYRGTWSAVGTGNIANTYLIYGSASNTYIEASPGPWAGSMYWRCNVVDRTMGLVVTFHDSGGAYLGGSLNSETQFSSGRWVRSGVAGVAPAGTVRAVVRLQSFAGAVWANADTIDATGVLTEDNAVAMHSYFDGDTPGVGYRWQSGANASWSEQATTDLPTPLRVADGRSWLRSPGLPGLDTTCGVSARPTRTHGREVTLLAPLGRRTLVPQAGARRAPEYTLDLVTLTDAQADELIAFMEGTPIAWMLFPGSRLNGTYVSLGALSERPHPKVGPEEVLWSVAAVEVSRPAGGIAYDPNSSWQSVATTSSSWQAVLNTYASWLDVLRGPTVAEEDVIVVVEDTEMEYVDGGTPSTNLTLDSIDGGTP